MFYKKFSFYIGNSIAFIVLTMICAIFSLGMYVNDGLALSFYVVTVVTFLLLFMSVYYLICTIADLKIRKKGILETAIIVKVYYRHYRFSPMNKMILFEYTDNKGKKIKTIENVNRFSYKFKENEKIKILTNGKKGLLNRTEYK